MLDDLISYYTSLKRIFFNKPFIPVPKRETKDWNNLNSLSILLQEKNIPFEEFILVQVRAYRARNAFPTPAHLLGIKALNRYYRYLKGRYRIGQRFRLDPHSAVILATGVYYAIEEFLKPFNQDMKAMMIFSFVKENKVDFEKEKSDKIWECYHYLLAKYEYFKQAPPTSLLEWGGRLEERRK